MKQLILTSIALLSFFVTTSIRIQAQPSTNGLILWLDSSYPASVKTDGNGAVSNWLNLAPGATNSVTYTGQNDNDTAVSFNSDAPVYTASAGANGHKVVSFDGNGYLDALSFSSETPLDLTVFVLAAASTNRGDFSAFMAFSQGEAYNDYQTGLNFDQGQNPSVTFDRLNLEGAKGGGNGGFQLLDTSPLKFGTFYLFELDYGGGPTENDDVFSALVDGVQVGSQTGSANNVSLNNCYIGARCFEQGFTTGANNDMVGQIAAVLVYDHQLTGTNLTQTREYLAGMLSLQLSIAPVTTGNLPFSWNSVSGLEYQLQTTTNLLSPSWQSVGGIVTATNSITFESVPIGVDRERFYRLQLIQ